MTTIILASSSPYRKQLLSKILPHFETLSPNIDETPLKGETALQLVKRLSISKAHGVAKQYSNPCLVIASDQVASFDNQIIGKPHNRTNALQQLQSFQGHSVSFITGLCLYNSASNTTHYAYDKVQVKFRSLSSQQLEHYLDAEQPYDCAGSFKSEGLGICLFEAIDSQDPNTLLGLPMIKLTTLLQSEGIDPLLLVKAN